MGTVSNIKTQRLLDPANGALGGQARVNAEIFTAVEILGRKLERVAAERDRLAQRLALIESQASVDEKTGKLYLPVVVHPEMEAPPARPALPRWLIPASLASVALALFSVAVVLFRPTAPPLTKDQIAVLNALSAAQFTQLEPDSKKWKTLAQAQTPKPSPPALTAKSSPAALAEKSSITASAAAPSATTAMPFGPETETPPDGLSAASTQTQTPASAPPENNVAANKTLTPAEEDAQVPPVAAHTATTAAPAENTIAKKPAAAKVADKTPAKTAAKIPAKTIIPATAAAGGLAPDATLAGDLAALQKRAYAGAPAAQHDLATLYAAGDDVPRNYTRARFWFTKAADQGVANASYNLGVMYHQGLGVTADMKKALYWYKKAADLGHPEAMYNLGIAYIEGIGTKTDIPKAVAYFERAANAGVSQAAYNLGVLYESNFIGPINIPEAIKWYRVAARQGHPQAAAALQRLADASIASGSSAADSSQAAQLAADIAPAAGRTDGPHGLLADIQRILMHHGLLPEGKPDGVLGQKTKDAIRIAEEKFGMTEDGKPSEALLDKLLQLPPTMGKTFP